MRQLQVARLVLAIRGAGDTLRLGQLSFNSLAYPPLALPHDA